jgi:hypothetical protein
MAVLAPIFDSRGHLPLGLEIPEGPVRAADVTADKLGLGRVITWALKLSSGMLQGIQVFQAYGHGVSSYRLLVLVSNLALQFYLVLYFVGTVHISLRSQWIVQCPREHRK